MKLKRLAVICSGWHYPYQFYKIMSDQMISKGWYVDLFCVAHRDPKHAKMPKFNKKTLRGGLDAKLYTKIATIKEIEALGWEYKEYPNTIGDWGNSNQWLADHNYKDYDLFLFTHDDNLLLRYDLLETVCKQMFKEDWLIITNSTGVPIGSLRGSFEFFKREMLDLMGGKFDLSETTLERTGTVDNPKDWKELFDWNTTVYPLANLLTEKELWEKVIVLSSQYRVSIFCIEGERGLISNYQDFNKKSEEDGLNWLKENKII